MLRVAPGEWTAEQRRMGEKVCAMVNYGEPRADSLILEIPVTLQVQEHGQESWLVATLPNGRPLPPFVVGSGEIEDAKTMLAAGVSRRVAELLMEGAA